ncbi:MAG: FUSC family protein [Actinomycetes bacterium]
MRIHDPGGAAFRRGVQLAIAVPLIAFLVSRVALDPEGVVYGALLATTILANSDFSGPWQVRVFGPIATAGFAGIAVVIGILASVNLVSVVLVTLVVGTGLAFVPTLRGLPAAGAPSVLLMYAIAVTTDVKLADLPKVVLGLAIGVGVTVVVLLLVFPRDARSQIRIDIAIAMRAQADYVSARWLRQGNPDTTYEHYRETIDTLTRDWIGKPFRPAGTAESNHALILLASRMRVVFDSLPGIPIPDESDDVSATATMAVATMRANADALDGISPPPSLNDIDDQREDARDFVVRQIRMNVQPRIAIEKTRRRHGAQILLALAADASVMVQRVLGDTRKTDQRTLETPERWWTDLAVNATLRSPWGRHAVRTGIALAAAAAVVSIADLSHGYWVILGVISVLRIDAAATGRQAARALTGTLVGVVIGFFVLLALNPYPAAVWLLAPIAAFMAAWSSRAIGFAVGQGAFSFFVLVLFGALSWPPQYDTAFDRLLDIGVGVGVALVVGLLMWPSGMVSDMRRALADALNTGAAGLQRSVDHALGRTSHATLSGHWPADRAVIRRASEAFDLCVVQRRDIDASQGRWARIAGDTHVLVLVGSMVGALPKVAPVPLPEHARVVDQLGQHTEEVWQDLAQQTQGGSGVKPLAHSAEIEGTFDPFAALAHASEAMDLDDETAAASLAVSVWLLDWLTLAEMVADRSFRSWRVP